MEQFADRHEAGKVLAEKLKQFHGKKEVIVLGLPRGGVPVASEIASALSIPLDVFIVRKLGVPGHEELAFGAIASGDVIVFNQDIVRFERLDQKTKEAVIEIEKKELKRREKKYRGNRPPLHLSGKTIILVDDGIATGATMRAAIQSIKQQQPAKIILAVPVIQETIYDELEKEVNQIIFLIKPAHLNAVGEWYRDFSQTQDEEVQAALKM